MSRPRGRRPAGGDPLWFKDAVIYETHVRAFQDSAGDGVGDFRGLAARLDYLQDLGVTALWLLPFFPSPLRDDGYDIADYRDVLPAYGTLADFRNLLQEAHGRGLRVVTELVLNHTSDRHPWFQRARRAKPGSRERSFYVWSDTPDRYADARIIFRDLEHSNWAWDPVAGAYYWHRFFAHQPDLNFDSPDVRREILRVVDFWLEMGVDGLRLDAVPYLFERDGTNCENLPETHAFLKELRAHADRKHPDRLLLAEANQWPEDAVAYFGAGDECRMAFHFPVMPRLFMALNMEDRYPIIDVLEQTPPIPETCQWALFLRNHDELTLEMVSDEERDYMWRVYARDDRARHNLGIRRRLAPLLGNNRRRIELMNALLFSLPGTPVLYYGDEIGMGDNVHLGDRNGVRTPMQWSADRNAGFSTANPQRLYLPVIIDPEYHYETLNVEAQQGNPSSLLWWMKRLIALRKRYRVFGRGSIEFLRPANRKVLAFVRRFAGETILVAANLSRYAQGAEIDLSGWAGSVPVEVFGGNEFPAVGDRPYVLTFGPHDFYWFLLRPAAPPVEVAADRTPPLVVEGPWHDLLEGSSRGCIEAALAAWLPSQRWFAGRARRIGTVRIAKVVPWRLDGAAARVTLAIVGYAEGDPETYLVPLSFVSGAEAERLRARAPGSVLAAMRAGGEDGLLFDATADPAFGRSLLGAIAERRRVRRGDGEISAVPSPAFRRLVEGAGSLEAAPLAAEQANTTLVFGDRFLLKLFRKVEEGMNPDLEVGRFLADRLPAGRVPPVAGWIEYRTGEGEAWTLGILQAFVRSESDAWAYTLDALEEYVERSLARAQPLDAPEGGLLDLAESQIPAAAADAIGTYLESARLLGIRTAEMHAALSSSGDPAFAPEAFTTHYQRALCQSMRGTMHRALQGLRDRLVTLSPATRAEAERVLGRERDLLAAFQAFVGRRITAARIRCHGDFHLGQVLFTGRDYVFMDFEGESARPISERRIKRSALRDVAGMLRSFPRAAYASLFAAAERSALPSDRAVDLEARLHLWHRWVSAAYLRAYLKAAGEEAFLPRSREELGVLLRAYLLEKTAFEIEFELSRRPERVLIPLRGILDLIGSAA